LFGDCSSYQCLHDKCRGRRIIYHSQSQWPPSKIGAFLRSLARGLGFHAELSSSEDEPPNSDAHTLLREQLEYYFSDANPEQSHRFKAEIARSDDCFVNIKYILTAAAESYFLDADFISRRIRALLERPAPPLPDDPSHQIRPGHPAVLTDRLFESLFPGKVQRVTLIRRGDPLKYTGVSIVELDSEELANVAAERGLRYGDGVLTANAIRNLEMEREARDAKDQREPKRSKIRW
jgi:hypothetical protein